jgi:hypothetical protein
MVPGGASAFAAEIEIRVEPASFYERVHGPWAREVEGDNVIEGDNDLPESFEFSDTKVFEHVGAVHHAGLLAQTIRFGPVCQVLGIMHSITPDEPVSCLTSSQGTLVAYVLYEVVVFNRSGTAEPMWVPVFIKAHLSATLSLRYYGKVGGTRPPYLQSIRDEATAKIQISREDKRGEPYEFSHSAEVVLHLEDPGTGESPPPKADSRSLNLAVLVWVGSYEGSITRVKVRQWVVAELGTGTYKYLGGDRDNYCEMLAFAQVDPEISIDPSWEHADKFGLVLPENVTMMPLPLPRLITPLQEPDGSVLIHWVGDGMLQESLTIGDSASWADSTNQFTPQSVTADASSRFYRVIARP